MSNTQAEREMLEAAAKACGINGKFSEKHPEFGDDWLERGVWYLDENDCTSCWNGLLSDGDCARMEAALGIDVGWSIGSVECFHVDVGYIAESYEKHSGDKQAARRMASLRVAAEIGRRMK